MRMIGTSLLSSSHRESLDILSTHKEPQAQVTFSWSFLTQAWGIVHGSWKIWTIFSLEPPQLIFSSRGSGMSLRSAGRTMLSFLLGSSLWAIRWSLGGLGSHMIWKMTWCWYNHQKRRSRHFNPFRHQKVSRRYSHLLASSVNCKILYLIAKQPYLTSRDLLPNITLSNGPVLKKKNFKR